MYTLEKTEVLKNFQYSVREKIDKDKQALFYSSYSSNAEDINMSNFNKLQKHKDTIDFALKYVEHQYKYGIKGQTILYPNDLNPGYEYFIYEQVKAKYRTENKICYNCTQKYWVYPKFIKTYGFRENSLKSKFQCFIEFVPAYKSKDTIKINLSMNKRCYDKRDSFYKDGFDLVYDKKDIHVRHISKQIVNLQEYNNIEKHIVINSWGDIHTCLIDKNYQNVDNRNRAMFSKDRKVVTGFYKTIRATKSNDRLMKQIRSFKNPELFGKKINSIKQSIKSRLENIIGSDNETKIILTVSTEIKDNIYKELVKELYNSTKNICARKGIAFTSREQTLKSMKASIKAHKEKSNDWRAKKSYGISYKDINHIRPYEYLLSCLLSEYKDFYPILRKFRKSPKKNSKNTDYNDSQVQKPDYPKYEQWLKENSLVLELYPNDYKAIKHCYAIEIARIAQIWYEDNFNVKEDIEDTQWL